MKTYSIPFVFLSLLSDSNQRPLDYPPASLAQLARARDL